MIKKMEKVYFIFKMVKNMMVNIKMIKWKEKEYIILMMEENMMVNGKMVKKYRIVIYFNKSLLEIYLFYYFLLY